MKSILGSSYNSKLIRFPGGSFGAKMASFGKAAADTGYHYIDWNDLTGDAEGQNISVTRLMSELRRYTEGNEHVVILMHWTELDIPGLHIIIKISFIKELAQCH